MNHNPELELKADSLDAPARILIVDDDLHNRHLLEVMLGPEGFLLLSAANGEDALAMVEKSPPDLILLDVMMPGMNGYQVAARLKGNPGTSGIPIIMVTALDDQDSRMLGLGAGAEEFLSKPVDRAELCVRVKNLLRLKAYADYHDKYGKLLESRADALSAELVDSERLFRATFDAAPVGIAHVAFDGRWLRLNQCLGDMLGYSLADLNHVTQENFLRSSEDPEMAEAFRRMAAGQLHLFRGERQKFRLKNGASLWARMNVSVLRDTLGEPQHLILVIEEIPQATVEAAAAGPR
jgi:PAS domain S-box-containing protein